MLGYLESRRGISRNGVAFVPWGDGREKSKANEADELAAEAWSALPVNFYFSWKRGILYVGVEKLEFNSISHAAASGFENSSCAP